MLIDSAGKEEADDDPTPDVPPKDVVEAIKELKLRFGNVDEKCASARAHENLTDRPCWALVPSAYL